MIKAKANNTTLVECSECGETINCCDKCGDIIYVDDLIYCFYYDESLDNYEHLCEDCVDKKIEEDKVKKYEEL